MRIVACLALLFAVAAHALQGGNPADVIPGTATITYDFTGFSPAIDVSVCQSATYANQGGGVRTYTVNTTNYVTSCGVSITEGGHLRFVQAHNITNGVAIVATNYTATLSINLQQYFPEEAGNTFCVRLLTDDGGSRQVFREYCGLASPDRERLPLAALTGGIYPANATTAYTVKVFRTMQAVWVRAYENRPATPDAVWVEGHTANGLTTDTNCADGVCNSGRLVAVLSVPLLCPQPTVNAWPATDVAISWDPTPVAYPVAQDFRVYPQQASGQRRYWLLAVNNYKVRVAYVPLLAGAGAPQNKTVEANCYLGLCEALPITAVLTVGVPGLSGSLQIAINGAPEWAPFPITGSQKFCVFGNKFTEAVVTFPTSPTPTVVANRYIDCTPVSQQCNAGNFTTQACPDYGCIAQGAPMGPSTVTLNIVADLTGVTLFRATGAPASLLRCQYIPAVPSAVVEVLEGPGCDANSLGACQTCAVGSFAATCAAQANACYGNGTTLCALCLTQLQYNFNPVLLSPDCLADPATQAVLGCTAAACPTCGPILSPSGCARYNVALRGCDGVLSNLTSTQKRSIFAHDPAFSGQPPAQCTSAPALGNFGRMLSVFELYFLSNSDRPEGVTVDLTTPDGVAFRHIERQGDAPRMYCVLPTVLKVMIAEGSDMWRSWDTSCVQDLPGPSDCSVCDFLTILKFDLVGLPRATNALLLAGPVGTDPTVFRVTPYVGDQQPFTKLSALRSGAGTLPPKQTCVLVSDNGATKQVCNVCDQKTCEFRNFTYDLCLDLSNPAGTTPGKGVDRLLTVELRNTTGYVFRTLIEQGGVNGIPAGFKRSEEDSEEAPLRRETRAAPYINNPTVPCYKVLMGTWVVRVSEFSVSAPDATVNCMSRATCNARGFLSLLRVNLVCGAGVPGNPTYPAAGLDVTLLDINGVQFRGPRIQPFTSNCTRGPATWAGPTCCSVGEMDLNIAVLRSAIQVRIENQKFGSGLCEGRPYPVLSEHPTVVVPADCTTPTCAANRNQYFSTLVIQSNRGLPGNNPGPQYATLKFGNAQNVIRIVQNSQLLAPAINQWCVVADPRPLYAVGWESYSSDGASRPFVDCASRTTTSQDVCKVGAGFVVTIPAMRK